MTDVTLEDAQKRLSQLIAALQPGEELRIIKDDCPVARLVKETLRPPQPRQPGSAAGKLIIVSEDEEHLQDFQEYMP